MAYYVDSSGKEKKVLTICSGVFPSGKKEITDTTEVNVRNYETAQVVDSNLIAENIKKDISILGVVGTFEEPTYEGSYEITENGTLQTSGKKLTQNLIVNVSSGGGGIDALIDGSITEITSNVASIKPYSFYQCKNLTTVNLPNISIIPDYAFYYCENLAIANFSPTNITTIGDWAFSNCYKLTSYNFPEVTTIGGYAFNGYRGEKAIFPKATKVRNYAFNGGHMTIIDFPLLTSTSNSEFRGCRNLVTINLPQLNTIGNNTFDGDDKLTTVVFPEVTEISGWAFNKCLNLETVDLPKARRVGGSEAFYYCKKLTTLILRANEVATLGSSNVFNYTPIATSTTEGFIYVPDDLVESYKSATNWSTYASKIKGLSELPTK